MIKLNSILVVVDPTVERDFVIDRATAIAKLTGARVTLYVNQAMSLVAHSYAYEGIDGKFFENQQQIFEQHYHELIQSASAEMRTAGIKTSIAFSSNHSLSEAVVQKAKSENYDLVIKSTHHHNLLGRSLLTNTDWQLIRKCSAPLLLVKPYLWRPHGAIVTAVDPMHPKAEQAALDWSLLSTTDALASQLEQTPHVFHSYFPFDSALFPLSGRSAEHIAKIKTHHEAVLKKLLSAFTFSTEHIHLSKGPLVPALIKTLKSTNANLLIIGALSRTILERAVVGDTAEKILEHCPCDILIQKIAPL